MGATKDQLHIKAIKDIYNFVKDNYTYKIEDAFVFDIYPICIQDICVDALMASADGQVHLIDTTNKNTLQKYRRNATEISTKYLKIALDDLKCLLKNKKK